MLQQIICNDSGTENFCINKYVGNKYWLLISDCVNAVRLSSESVIQLKLVKDFLFLIFSENQSGERARYEQINHVNCAKPCPCMPLAIRPEQTQ